MQSTSPSYGQAPVYAPVTGGWSWSSFFSTFGGSITGNLNLSGTTRELQMNALAGSAGQVLTSSGTGVTPTWTDKGYTKIAESIFSGTQPSFSSIPQTYKKLVVQISFTNIGGLAGTFSMSSNTRSNTAYTTYSTGSTASSTAGGTPSGLPLTTSATAPTTGNIYTVEIPNYTSPNPTMWLSGGVGVTTNASRWGVGTVISNITQISFEATTNTWTGATGTATIYGVN